MNLKKILGSQFPIIQAPMAGAQDHKLALAVTSAGGIGSIPCALLTLSGVKDELTQIAAKTKLPYNINFFCHKLPDLNDEKINKWDELLEPYFQELNIDRSKISPPIATRLTFNAEIMQVLAEFKPPIISFHFGLPAENYIQEIKSWGSKILSSATTVEEALWLEEHGTDVIIAQGEEAGGHRAMFLTKDLSTQLPLVDLLPKILKAVNLPVIAAGGISNKDQVKQFINLGAIAAQVGSAYLLSPETKTSKIYRSAIKNSTTQSTVITNVLTGRPARGIINRIIRELGPINQFAPDFPLPAGSLSLLKTKAEELGINDFSAIWGGVNVGQAKELPAGEITLELAKY